MSLLLLTSLVAFLTNMEKINSRFARLRMKSAILYCFKFCKVQFIWWENDWQYNPKILETQNPIKNKKFIIIDSEIKRLHEINFYFCFIDLWQDWLTIIFYCIIDYFLLQCTTSNMNIYRKTIHLKYFFLTLPNS